MYFMYSPAGDDWKDPFRGSRGTEEKKHLSWAIQRCMQEIWQQQPVRCEEAIGSEGGSPALY